MKKIINLNIGASKKKKITKSYQKNLKEYQSERDVVAQL